MKAVTQVLPESYALYHQFYQTRYKKAGWVSILLGLLLFSMSFAFFNSLARFMRPEYQFVEHLHFQLSMDRLTILLSMLLPVAFVLILHECIHALLLWLYTKERPILVVTWTGVGGIAVRMPLWYFSRNTFLMINLAPASLITLAVLLFVLMVPLTAIGILVLRRLNLAGSFRICFIYLCLFTSRHYLPRHQRVVLSRTGYVKRTKLEKIASVSHGMVSSNVRVALPDEAITNR
jgi:hypothetical protein